MSADGLRALVGRLNVSASAVAAVGAVLDAKVARREVPVAVRAHLDEVLAALDVRDDVAALTAEEARPMLAEIRIGLRQALARVAAPTTPGWTATDPVVLQEAGDVSIAFARHFRSVLPQLGDLGARLEREGARFLDVGVGVAALSIEMARLWPRLGVVGLDVWAPSLALARANVERAGLGARIELRALPAQELRDEAAFDVAWLPSVFLPPAALLAALPRLRRALRPGGWLLFASPTGGGDALVAALGNLRTAEWGGTPWRYDEAVAELAAAGLDEVAPLPARPGVPFRLIAARARV